LSRVELQLQHTATATHCNTLHHTFDGKGVELESRRHTESALLVVMWLCGGMEALGELVCEHVSDRTQIPGGLISSGVVRGVVCTRGTAVVVRKH